MIHRVQVLSFKNRRSLFGEGMATPNENRIIVNLTPGLVALVKKRAADTNRSNSNFVKDLIVDWAKKLPAAEYPERKEDQSAAFLAPEDSPKPATVAAALAAKARAEEAGREMTHAQNTPAPPRSRSHPGKGLSVQPKG